MALSGVADASPRSDFVAHVVRQWSLFYSPLSRALLDRVNKEICESRVLF